jgi:hypothetical protein
MTDYELPSAPQWLSIAHPMEQSRPRHFFRVSLSDRACGLMCAQGTRVWRRMGTVCFEVQAAVHASGVQAVEGVDA